MNVLRCDNSQFYQQIKVKYLKTIHDLNVPFKGVNTTPAPPPRANIAIRWTLRKDLYFCMTFNVEDSPTCVLKVRRGREKST